MLAIPQGIPNCTESYQYWERAQLDDGRFKPEACPAGNAMCSLSICLAHCSGEESEQAKCTRLQGSHTPLEYSVLCSLPTLKPLSQNDNGCLTGIHIIVCELRVPFCLHAKVNGYLLVCMLTPPAQCPMSTAVCKRPPHAVGRAVPTNPVSTHARATSKTFALGPTWQRSNKWGIPR